MGFFDNIKLTFANPKEPLPPVNQYSNSTNTLYGRGDGNLLAQLFKKLPSSNRDWVAEAGDLSLNSIVAISVRWYLTNFSQVEFVLKERVGGQYEEVEDAEIIDLLRDPMSGRIAPSQVYGNFIQDYLLKGNAYLRKIRGVGRSVIALEYIPADMMRAEGTQKVQITNYVYTTQGSEFQIALEDIIHWRYGRDTTDIRYGRSPITALLREVASDNLASSTAYGLLRNGAIPSFIIGPDASNMAVDISSDDARQIKNKMRQDFTGDQAGGISVMSGAYKLDKISYSPSELDLGEIRRLPEERIPAAFGLNAVVLGLGAGLERSTYNNYQQAQEAAWSDGMLPLLDSLCEILTYSLLIDFAPAPGSQISYDLSSVRALAEDKYEESKRASELYKNGVISRAQAKKMIGIEAEAEDDMIYFTSVPTIVPAEAPLKSINLKFYPNATMIDNANRALAWKEEGRDGGTRIGLARANQISNREKLSEDTILRMYSFFSRHEVDKEAEGFSSGEDGFPSPGRVAWDLWGGDAGFAWSRRIRDKIMNSSKNISIPHNVDEEDYAGYK